MALLVVLPQCLSLSLLSSCYPAPVFLNQYIPQHCTPTVWDLTRSAVRDYLSSQFDHRDGKTFATNFGGSQVWAVSGSLPTVIFPSSLPACALLLSNPSAICAVSPGGWALSRVALQQRTSIEVDTPVLTLNLWNWESISHYSSQWIILLLLCLEIALAAAFISILLYI